MVKFKLETAYILILNDVAYIPSFRRNLISISKMDCVGYYFGIGNGSLNLVFNLVIVGTALLCDGLYKLNFSSMATSLNVENVGVKRTLIRENSSTLWYKWLGHISKEMMERLVKNDILPTVDFNYFGTCVDFIKGKLTKSKKRGATRSNELLKIIHTEISGPYVSILCGNKYFLTFIDDFFAMDMYILLWINLKHLKSLRFSKLRLRSSERKV